MKILKTVFAALLLVTVGTGTTCWAQNRTTADFGSLVDQTGPDMEEANSRRSRRAGGMGVGRGGMEGGMEGGMSMEMDMYGGGRGREPSAQREAALQVQQATEKLNIAKNEEEKQTAKIALEEALVHQFDLDIENRRKELDAIKKRLTEMETLLEKRVAGKTDIVALKLQMTVNNASGLGWPQRTSIRRRGR